MSLLAASLPGLAHPSPPEEATSSSAAASAARACLNILCGASHITVQHASDVKELLRSLAAQGGGEADNTLASLRALASCLHELLTHSSDMVSPTMTSRYYT